MWKGHEPQLLAYAECICLEWIERGYRDTLLPQFYAAWNHCPPSIDGKLPSWLGCEEFHSSHRSNLLRKLPSHYSRFGWVEPDNLPYVWPTHAVAA